MKYRNGKERAEGRQIEVFLRLLNEKHNTDYEVGPPEDENSIVDRKGISKSGNHKNLNIQIKDVKKLDTSYFTESIMGKGVHVFDTNIFNLLTPALQEIDKKYGKSAEDIILVLNTGASESWMVDYEIPEWLEHTHFRGIYSLSLPSSEDPKGYIFALKQIRI